MNAREVWLDRGRRLLDDYRSLLAPFGVSVDPELDLQADTHPCPGYTHEDRRIRFCPPVIEGNADRLRWAFFSGYMGCRSVEEAAAFYDLALPLIVAHELAHHLRLRSDLASPSAFIEEQACDRLAVALVEAAGLEGTLAPLQEACARLRARLDERFVGGDGAGFVPDLADALEHAEQLGSLRIESLLSLADARRLSFERVASLVVGIDPAAIEQARQRRERARLFVEAHYARDPAAYWHLSLRWIEGYLARKRPGFGEILNEHLLVRRPRSFEVIEGLLRALDHGASGEREAAAIGLLEILGGELLHDLADRCEEMPLGGVLALLHALDWHARDRPLPSGDALTRLVRALLSRLASSGHGGPLRRGLTLAARLDLRGEIARLLDRHPTPTTFPLLFHHAARSGLPLDLPERATSEDAAAALEALVTWGGTQDIPWVLDLLERWLESPRGKGAALAPRLLAACRVQGPDAGLAAVRLLGSAGAREEARALGEALLELLPSLGGLDQQRLLSALESCDPGFPLERLPSPGSAGWEAYLRWLKEDTRRTERARQSLDTRTSLRLGALLRAAGQEDSQMLQALAAQVERELDAVEAQVSWVRWASSRHPLGALAAREVLLALVERWRDAALALGEPGLQADLVRLASSAGEEPAPTWLESTLSRALAPPGVGGVREQYAGRFQRALALLRQEDGAEERSAGGEPPGLPPLAALVALDLHGAPSEAYPSEVRLLIERLSHLRLVPLFAALSPSSLVELARATVEVSLDTGAFLFRQGDPGDRLFVLLVGQLRVLRGDRGEAPVQLRSLHPPACVGEIALFDGAPRSATVEALGPCRLLALDGEAVRRLGRAHPEVYEALLRVMAERLRNALREERADRAVSGRTGQMKPGDQRVLHVTPARVEIVAPEDGAAPACETVEVGSVDGAIHAGMNGRRDQGTRRGTEGQQPGHRAGDRAHRRLREHPRGRREDHQHVGVRVGQVERRP